MESIHLYHNMNLNKHILAKQSTRKTSVFETGRPIHAGGCTCDMLASDMPHPLIRRSVGPSGFSQTDPGRATASAGVPCILNPISLVTTKLTARTCKSRLDMACNMDWMSRHSVACRRHGTSDYCELKRLPAERLNLQRAHRVTIIISGDMTLICWWYLVGAPEGSYT